MQPLVGARAGVDEVVVGPDRARQHLEQRELADVGVGDRLEHERERLAVGVGGHLDCSVSPALTSTPGRSAGDGPISQMKSASRSMATAVDGRAAHDREHRRRGDADGERVLELLDGGDVALEVALEQLVVGDDDALDEVVVHLVLERLHVVGDLAVRCAVPPS